MTDELASLLGSWDTASWMGLAFGFRSSTTRIPAYVGARTFLGRSEEDLEWRRRVETKLKHYALSVERCVERLNVEAEAQK